MLLGWQLICSPYSMSTVPCVFSQRCVIEEYLHRFREVPSVSCPVYFCRSSDLVHETLRVLLPSACTCSMTTLKNKGLKTVLKPVKWLLFHLLQHRLPCLCLKISYMDMSVLMCDEFPYICINNCTIWK
jgi:hypothetical protein